MSVDILRDSASARSQRRRNLKGEGYRQLTLPIKKSGQSKKHWDEQLTHEKTAVLHHNSMEK